MGTLPCRSVFVQWRRVHGRCLTGCILRRQGVGTHLQETGATHPRWPTPKKLLQRMSAIPPKADIGTQPRDVRFVPKADITPFVLAPRRPRSVRLPPGSVERFPLGGRSAKDG